MGGLFTYGAAKKGLGTVVIYDGDEVAASNLNRQFFTPQDVHKNKAVCLARNVSKVGFMGTRLVGVPYYFQAAVERGLEVRCDIACCFPDNDETRVSVARQYLDRPVVFAAVSEDAGHGYVAVQEPGKACFGCFRPQALGPEQAVSRADGACPRTPAVFDVVGLVAVVALYAVDSLVMNRPRKWNFKQIALHGLFPEINAKIPKREGCPLCGGRTVAT